MHNFSPPKYTKIRHDNEEKNQTAEISDNNQKTETEARKMKEYKVSKEIKQLKEKRFRKNSVANQLGANWRTIDRYWDMGIEEYE